MRSASSPRITESTFIAMGILSVFRVVSPRGSGIDSAALPFVARALVAIKDWSFQFEPGLVVPIGNGMLPGWMMYRSRIVPRGLALLDPYLGRGNRGRLFCRRNLSLCEWKEDP